MKIRTTEPPHDWDLLRNPPDFSLVLGGPATQQAGAEGSIGADTGQGEDIVPSVASSMLRGFMARAWRRWIP